MSDTVEPWWNDGTTEEDRERTGAFEDVQTLKKIELADYYRLPQEQRRQYDVLPVMRYYPCLLYTSSNNMN